MTQLNGIIVIEKGKHRFYHHLWVILAMHATFGAAMRAIGGNYRPYKPGGMIRLDCKRFPREVDIQLTFDGVDVVQLMMRGAAPDKIKLRIAHIGPPPQGLDFQVAQPALMLRMITPTFVEFFEENVDWLLANMNPDKSKWTPVWTLARVIRNAIIHRGVSWDNHKAAPVTWHGLTYSHADNGTDVVSRDLSVADLIVLMLEMSDELDRLGCPVPV